MYISANIAMSADAKISTRSYTPARFTSQRDSQRLLELRKDKDALLVGRGTLLADTMTMRVPDQSQQPLRCIVSRSSPIPSDHPILQSKGGLILLCHTEAKTPTERTGMTDTTNNSLTRETTLQHYSGSLPAFLHHLEDQHGVKTLHCEGGGMLLKSLLALDLLDELHLTLAAHTLFGGKEAPTLTGQIGDYLATSQHFILSHFEPTSDSECFLTYQKTSV